jgi:hypothetical protein
MSKFLRRAIWWVVAVGCGLCGLPRVVEAQWAQQSIPLRPGWNAVFLEVDPRPEACDELFAGMPVESVWDWNRQVDSVQFLQDPASLIPGAAGWLTWFPPGHALASATNFVGFHVGAQGPTFSSLFSGEPGLSGQPVYRLGGTGVWEPIAALTTERPRSGEAYWVRCRLPAQRTGTIEVDPGLRAGMRFADGIAEVTLRVRNTSSAARTLSVRLLPSAEPPEGEAALIGLVPLEYWKTDFANAEIGWEPIPSTLSFPGLPAGGEWNVRMGVRRPAGALVSPGSEYQGLLEVTDDLGTRWLVGVGASAGSDAVVSGGLQPNDVHDGFAHAGLWVGDAVINAVSQPAHTGNPTLPRPAGSEFAYRLTVHVDGGGQARLLQRAYLVRKPAVLVPDPENPGFNVEVEPARTVVVSDEGLISGIIGGGAVVGRRISSAAFGFKEPQVLNGGPFGVGSLSGQLTLGYDDPLNPFKHVYHPDHNNLDTRFEQTLPEGRESFTVIRQVALDFTGTDPLGLNPPGWGDREIGGVYRETFTGLHRSAIQISGTFRLVKVSGVADLDDSAGGAVAGTSLGR